MHDYDSKHWPGRTWRRLYLAVLSAGTAALLVAGISSPDVFIWH